MRKKQTGGDIHNNLSIAIMNDDLERVKRVLPLVSDINRITGSGDTHLMDAARNGRVNSLDIVKLLVNNGANIDMPAGFNHNTPLHLACSHNNYDIARFLISRGANINAININSRTPLHIAAENGYLDIVRLLIENGAQILALGCFSTKYTPIDRAREANKTEVVRYLESLQSSRRISNSFRNISLSRRSSSNNFSTTSPRFNYFKLMKFGIEMEILHNFMLNQSTEYERNRIFSLALNKYRNHLISRNRENNILDRKYYHVLARRGYNQSPFDDSTIPQLPGWYRGTWVIEHDVTVVRMNANNANYNEYTEIVSPPLSVYKNEKSYYSCSDFGPTVLKNMIGKLFPHALPNNNIVSVKYKNNSRCSMHTHISCVDNSGDNKLLKPNNLASACLYWKLFEDVFMGLVKPFRHHEQNRKYFKDTTGLYPQQVEDYMTVRQIVELVNGGIGRDYRYQTLNLQNLIEGHGTIEVRIHHGSFNSKEMSYWVFALTLFFNYAMSEGYRKGARQVANEVSHLKNRLTTYKLKFDYLFNKIIKSSYLGQWFVLLHNIYYSETKISYDSSSCDVIDDCEVRWILDLISSTAFWNVE